VNFINVLIITSCIVSLFILPNVVLAESKNDLLNKGNEALEKEKYKEAIKYFDKVLKIEPKNTDALNGKGVAFLSLGQYNTATSYFDKVLKIEPKNTDALNGKGAVLYFSGKHKTSLTYFDKVLKINPNEITALLFKGFYYVEGGKYKTSLTYFDKVLKIDPKNKDAYDSKQSTLQLINEQSQQNVDPRIAEINKKFEEWKKESSQNNKSTDITQYKLFFLNSQDDECSTRNIQAMNFYNDVTKSYFSLYGINYSALPPQCITSSQTQLIDNEITSNDLVIVMADAISSTSHLYLDNHAWGYYRLDVPLIMSNSISLSTKSGSSAWTLTHELSHHILKTQNQPENIYVDWVHNIQAQVSQCKSETSWSANYGSMSDCPKSLYKTITVQGKNVDVFPPYGKSSSDSSGYSYDTRTVLTLNGVPSQANTGQLVTFTGSLKNTEGLPVQGATIYIKDEDAGSGDEILTTATTNSNGLFSASWYVKNTDFWDSTIEVYAVYEGSYEVQKSKTGIYNLFVIE
jgi:tetratricopeptide (TPR) repeat protein